MAYLDEFRRAIKVKQPKQARSNALAVQYPEYEQSIPQYITPSPYSLASQGFKANTLIYACIMYRMSAISAAPMWIYDVGGAQAKVMNDLRARQILKAPNERMSERQFWQVTQMYLDIAGSAIWEIEYNKVGEYLNLWPMRPDWCSFKRGNGRPIAFVRYAPPGMEEKDVPIDNVLLFQYQDPLNPMLKGYSPTMAALRDIGLDNSMSSFLTSFISSGAKFSGVLSTDQDLDDNEAERIRSRWKTQHGGTTNWSDIVVLGHGTEYQPISMDFDEMAFPELDARTEARICMAFQIPPILIGTKIGLQASSYSNYEQARKAWYEEWVTPQWEFLAEQYGVQMLKEPDQFGRLSMPANYLCEFMVKKVAALQVNRDLAFRRSISAARSNVITRDEARQEIGYDAVDNAPVFIGPVSNSNTNAVDDIAGNGSHGIGSDRIANEDLGEGSLGADAIAGQDELTDASIAAQSMERKQFASFAKRRIAEGKAIEVFDFQWKFHTNDEAIMIVRDFMAKHG